MKRKSLFYYGMFFTGPLIALVWFVGGETLDMQGLAFNRENTAQIENSTSIGSKTQKSNKTARVVQGVLSAYREVANTDGSIDPSQIEAILRDKLGTALTENIDPITVQSIGVSDLHIVADTGANEISYIRGMANLVRNNYYDGLSQELDVFNNAFVQTASAREKDLSRVALSKASDTYKKLAVGLSKLSVPSHDVNQIVTLTNAYFLLSTGSDLLAQSFSDPVLSLQGIQVYAKGYLMLKGFNK